PGDMARPVAINATGQAVGTVWKSTPPGGLQKYEAALWSNSGNIQPLGTLPGYESSRAFGINAAGQVVGSVSTLFNDNLTSDPITYRHAFLWDRATGMTDLNTLLPANSGWVLE